MSDGMIRRVLSAPEQQVEVRPGRIVLQSRIATGERAGMYLIRVVVDINREPAEVVTAYRTSKIAKYWREEA